MATELKRKLDYADYLRLPDDGKRYEILDGELYVADAAHAGRPWVVIVEPDPVEHLLVVVTVYQVSS